MSLVRASNGTRFRLTILRMIQTNSFDHWYTAERLDLKKALASPGLGVGYQLNFSENYNNDGPQRCYVSILHGKTQRHKRYIQIGCMRFVGKERTKLIRWAKAAK